MEVLLTKENITLAIAILGLLGSIFSWVFNFLSRRKKIRFLIYDYQRLGDIHQFVFSIENLSQLPISISRIFLVIDNKKYECTYIPKRVSETTREIGRKVIERKSEYSLPMPIVLTSLGAMHGYVIFENCPKNLENPQTPATLLLHTNRGRPMKLKAQLVQNSHQDIKS